MNLVIRAATEQDASTLEEIERLCFHHDPWVASDFLKGRCVVAEVDGRVVGFVVARDVYPGDEEALAEREILNLAVVPSHQGLGIGRALMDWEIRHPGIYTLEVRESNLAAQRLYRRLGFEEFGRRRCYYESPRENAIVMRMERC